MFSLSISHTVDPDFVVHVTTWPAPTDHAMHRSGAGEGEIRRLVLDAKYGPYAGMQYGRQPLGEAATMWYSLSLMSRLETAR